MEILRAGPPRWLGAGLFGFQALLYLVAAAVDFRWWRALFGVLLLVAAVWVPRAETSVFTATGARVRRYGLRWRTIPWAEVEQVREVDRWSDGARLVLRTGEVIKLPYVPRSALPALRERLTEAGQR